MGGCGADNAHAGGGAVQPNFLGVAVIGPGYDHSAVPGRTPLVVPAQGRAFYERAWRKVLRKSAAESKSPDLERVPRRNQHRRVCETAGGRTSS